MAARRIGKRKAHNYHCAAIGRPVDDVIVELHGRELTWKRSFVVGG
jgi:hypothetical protein